MMGGEFNGSVDYASSVQDDLVATLSHELRAPLSHIKGFVTTLLQTDVEWDEAIRRDFLVEIDRAADRLARLIDERAVLPRGCAEGGARGACDTGCR